MPPRQYNLRNRKVPVVWVDDDTLKTKEEEDDSSDSDYEESEEDEESEDESEDEGEEEDEEGSGGELVATCHHASPRSARTRASECGRQMY